MNKNKGKWKIDLTHEGIADDTQGLYALPKYSVSMWDEDTGSYEIKAIDLEQYYVREYIRDHESRPTVYWDDSEGEFK